MTQTTSAGPVAGTIPQPLLALLQCPTCATRLVAGEGALRCGRCATDYPVIDGVPWLLPDPARALGHWNNRIACWLAGLERQGAACAQALQEPLPAATLPRLRAWREGISAHLAEVRALLAPWGLPAGPAGGSATAEAGLQSGLLTAPPAGPGPQAYYANLFRDWCWGEAENAASLALVLRQLQALPAPPPVGPLRVLVPGAGGARLAADLHAALVGGAWGGQPREVTTVAFDLNPLYLATAARVIGGGTVSLHEFPLAPRTAADGVVGRALRAPATVPPGCWILGADALRAPFASRTFDLVVTPWFVDIVPEPFADLARRVNAWLVPGGTWLNFGALAFSHADPRHQPALEELPGWLEAAGFGSVLTVNAALPYLQSPASRHARVEEVAAFTAVKRQKCAPAPERPASWPWLLDRQLPVPALPALEVAGIASRVQGFVLALVDGQRSIDAIAAALVAQGVLPPAQATAAVQAVLERLAAPE
jgi:uncharacterized protein YbaR (Trm112 family)